MRGAVRGFRVATATAMALLASGCDTSSQPAAERECARAVIEDWSDGKIDGVYPDNCYLAAIDALPEDLRAYTSAGDDIWRALQSRRPAAERE